MSETASANDAPVSARMSGSFSWSAESTRRDDLLSRSAQPAGKSGRSGRSMKREVSTSFSLGRPSRRKNRSGDLAGRVRVLAVVDRQRQEIDALAGVFAAHAPSRARPCRRTGR